ncbi:MAG TPA: hypothetical protein PLG30_12430 [Bacteroidia bacterium]|nr:hypothetical protein [Bacteroidia bacterium]
METNRNLIIEKAEEIIMNTGLEALTIHNLAAEMDLKENQLYNQLTKDDDILLILLYGFEADIIEFVNELHNKGVTPETELELFFNALHFYFQQKPYYLSLIFDKNLMKRDESVKKAVLRIKIIIEDYLTDVIKNGKKQNIFKIEGSIRPLVNRILSGFRFQMKDEHLLNNMILEMKKLQTSKD